MRDPERPDRLFPAFDGGDRHSRLLFGLSCAGSASVSVRRLSASNTAGSGVWMSVARTAADGAWVETAAPGVRMKVLAIDRARDRVTMLLRGEPGVRYPAYRHSGPEECYVMSGSLIDGDAQSCRAASAVDASAGKKHSIRSSCSVTS